MAGQHISIVKTGTMTSVGMNTAQTAASVRAGISRAGESSICDKHFEPFVMAILPDDVLPPLDPDIEKETGLTARQRRMLRLAAPALQEAMQDIKNIDQIPLYLGVPEPFPARPNPVNDLFIKYLCIQSGIQLNIQSSKLISKGRAAGLLALNEAIQDLSSGIHKHIMVGGVDTYVDLYQLATLDMNSRILGRTVMDGFVPGEGAGFILLTSDVQAKSKNIIPLAMLSQVSTGFEVGHLYSEKPYKGDGLATAFEKLFQTKSFHEPIMDVYSSMNGENHWAKEWGVAYLRHNTAFSHDQRMHHPAEFLGDTGAASGIIMIILAVVANYKGYGRCPSLITCSSDFGDRAAVVLNSN